MDLLMRDPAWNNVRRHSCSCKVTEATSAERRCLRLTVDEVAPNGRAGTALKALDVSEVTGSTPVFVANKQRGFKKASRKMT